MMQTKATLTEQVRKLVVYTPVNPCYRDFVFYNQLCADFGKDNVDKEIDRQEKMLDFFARM